MSFGHLWLFRNCSNSPQLFSSSAKRCSRYSPMVLLVSLGSVVLTHLYPTCWLFVSVSTCCQPCLRFVKFYWPFKSTSFWFRWFFSLGFLSLISVSLTFAFHLDSFLLLALSLFYFCFPGFFFFFFMKLLVFYSFS